MSYGAVIGAAASTINSAGSAAISAKQARLDRAFRERMFDTRYQRTVRDLRAAGLNPILATRHGPGTVPGGGPIGQVPDLGASTARGVEAGVRASLQSNQKRELATRADSNTAAAERLATQATYDQQQTDESFAREKREVSQERLNTINARKAEAEARLLEADIPAATAKQKVDESWWGSTLREINRVSQALQGVGSTARDVGIATGAARRSQGQIRERERQQQIRRTRKKRRR